MVWCAGKPACAGAGWQVTRLATAPEPFALSVLVLAGFIRVATNPRLFDCPSTLDTAFAFVASLGERPTARIIAPGPDHMAIFERLCRSAQAIGKLVEDAQRAAMAMEHGCTLVSTDADFGRFPGLQWQHPLGPPSPCLRSRHIIGPGFFETATDGPKRGLCW